MRRLAAGAGLAALLGAYSAAALAEPARIILLRHAEKKNSRDLCDVGQLRAQALSDQYLGKGAPGNDTIYGKGGRPDAFFAITAHTRETATPASESWGMEPTLFPVRQRIPTRRATSTRKPGRPRPPSPRRVTTARSLSSSGSTSASPTRSSTRTGRRCGRCSNSARSPTSTCRRPGRAQTTTISGSSITRTRNQPSELFNRNTLQMLTPRCRTTPGARTSTRAGIRSLCSLQAIASKIQFARRSYFDG